MFPKLIPWLAWTEFRRALSWRAPGGRDLFWMAALLCLLQLLALIILTARAGVVDRSVDTFLGNKAGYGIPVWTRPNTVGFGTPSLISDQLVAQANANGFHAEPFRRIYNATLVALPDHSIWTAPRSRASEFAFSGMAADFNGPLFPAIREATQEALQDPLTAGIWPIVLNLDLFTAYFDLDAYRTSVMGRIPPTQVTAIPEDKARLTEMPVIWMQVDDVHTRHLVPFRIIWGRHFGIGQEPSAFMVERRFENAVTAIRRNPDLCVDVTGGPDLPEPVTGMFSAPAFLMPADEKAALAAHVDTQLGPLAAAFGGSLFTDGTRLGWQASEPAPRSACPPWVPAPMVGFQLADTDAQLTGASETSGAPLFEPVSYPHPPQFSVTTTDYTAPCTLPSGATRLPEIGTRAESDDRGCVVTVPSALGTTGYGEMLMFAPERSQIEALVTFLNCADARQTLVADGGICRLVDAPGQPNVIESHLMIDEVYEDTLYRFDFLVRLLDTVSGPIGIVLFVLLVAILLVQIGTVVGHRRGDYALMLSSGLSHGNLVRMVIVQQWIAIVMSLAVALALFAGVSLVMGLVTGPLALRYEPIFQGVTPDLLPLSWQMVAGVGLGVFALAWVLAVLQMRLNGISRHRSLDALLR